MKLKLVEFENRQDYVNGLADVANDFEAKGLTVSISHDISITSSNPGGTYGFYSGLVVGQ